MKVTTKHARRVIELVDFGLTEGLGVPEPGKMCVEAAVSFALGLKHSDEPDCVGRAVRAYKIQLNDSAWPSNEDRAAGLRQIAVAQLGSDTISQVEFAAEVSLQTCRLILPVVLRLVAKLIPSHADKLLACAAACEIVSTLSAASDASDAARAASYAARAASYAARAASDASDAASYASYAASYASDAEIPKPIFFLHLSAKIGLEALIKLKSPGCKWLYLTEEATLIRDNIRKTQPTTKEIPNAEKGK